MKDSESTITIFTFHILSAAGKKPVGNYKFEESVLATQGH
jgi:hypothetical protein